MASVDLIFAVHNHQPVGNFDFVVEDAYQRSYAPFIKTLERHPDVRFCLHQPGILWQWCEQHHPEYLECVARLVQRGQVELLTGGYNEPILPVIPERDRQGQISALSAWLRERFDVEPHGAWLAERVWEPPLAATLARAGVQYTVVDDAHFTAAGLSSEDLHGYFVTEDDGQPLYVFPIAQKLRYLLPFAECEEAFTWMRAQSRPGRDTLLVHADDGEKFGVWPGTFDRCYDGGWLEQFLGALERSAEWLRTTTFSDALASRAAQGRVYLPTASYDEMSEWALPVAAQPRLRAARERARENGDGSFVRGGFWRNFLARYPESNWMHKKMLYVSHRTAQLARQSGVDRVVRDARAHLWRGQCNCAYWHGVFGGLYLPHLRSAVYSELIHAEALLDSCAEHPPAAETLDFDADGRPEVLLRSADAVAVVKPDAGGAVFELDSRRHAFNVLDVMTRRPEAYHALLRRIGAAEEQQAGTDGAQSIHEIVRTKEPGLHRALVYDGYRRGAFVDHLLPLGARFEDFVAARLPELAALARSSYQWQLEADVLHLERTTPLHSAAAVESKPSQDATVHVRRRMSLEGAALTAAYTVSVDGSRADDCRFAVEMVANLQAGEAPDRWLEVDGRRLAPGHLASRGRLERVRRLELVDAWRQLRIVIEANPAMDVWRTPLESVSMSEKGFERVYQGSAFLFLSHETVQVGQPWSGSVRLRVESL